MPGRASARMSRVARPGTFSGSKCNTRPWAVTSTARSAGVTPSLRAKPSTALGGADLAGPVSFSSASCCRTGRRFGAQHQAARRGIQGDAIGRAGWICVSSSSKSARRLSSAPGIIQSGISSVPISSRKGRLTCATSRAAPARLLLIHPGLRHPHRQLAHALDHAHALGDADGAARIERIKEVGALQHVVVGRQQREAPLLRRLSDRPRSAGAASPSCRSNSFQSVATSAISKL